MYLNIKKINNLKKDENFYFSIFLHCKSYLCKFLTLTFTSLVIFSDKQMLKLSNK